MQAQNGSTLKMRCGWPCLAAVLACTATLCAAYWGARLSLRLTAERLEVELSAAHDHEVQPIVERLAALGPAGIAALVRASASDRSVLARAARMALVAEMARWETLTDEAAYARLELMADGLAAEVGDFDPSARAFAKDLVLRMLVWPRRGDRDDRRKLTAACERILRIDLQSPPPRSIARRAPLSDESGTGRDGAVLAGQTLASGLESPRVLEAEVLADGAAALPPLAPVPTTGADRALEGTAPIEAQKPHAAPGDRDGIDERSPRGGRIAAGASGDRAATYEAAAPLATREATAEHHALDQLSQLSAFDLFAKLDEADALAVDAARAELMGRGFAPGEIEIGRHLTSADALERRQWAEVLPRVSGLDAKPWLLWLSRDGDAGVRTVAASLMATTNDPDLLARLRQMAADDDDPRVVEQASRRWK